MTLDELLTQFPDKRYEDLHGSFLVFVEQLKNNLLNGNGLQPDKFKVAPVELADGRFAIPADLLSETDEGGYYTSGYTALNTGNFPLVEVLTQAELDVLLPDSDPTA